MNTEVAREVEMVGGRLASGKGSVVGHYIGTVGGQRYISFNKRL